jgi:hypothetical protein
LAGAAQAGVLWISLTLHPRHVGTGLAENSLVSLQLRRSGAEDLFFAPTVDADPGEYLLVMHASSKGGASSCSSTQAVPIHLPKAGDVFADLELELWGRFTLHVDVQMPEGTGLTIHQFIRDTDGAPVVERQIRRVHFDQGEGDEGYMDEESGNPGLGGQDFGWRFNGGWKPSGASSSKTWGRLPAGQSRLEVRADGCENWSESITIHPGKLARFPVKLSSESGE